MTREEAIEIIRKEYACVDADCDIERSCGKCELHMPSKEPILKAYEMAIQALSQEPTEKPMCDRNICISNEYNGIGCDECVVNKVEQEPCDVSVSEKEPNEITEEVTLRFFKNSLKVRWHDFVIYNVEWLKKNWQMEMDIVCGVKPCADAVSRQEVLSKKIYTETEEGWSGYTVDADYIEHLPSVTQKSGKWLPLENRIEWGERVKCSECGQVFVVGDDVSRKYCPNCGCRMESEDKE